MNRAIAFLLMLPGMAHAQGWGNVGNAQENKGSFWTDPLFGGTWMAWTGATMAVFVGIFTAIGVLVALEIRYPGGDERRGALGLVTTRGDRLFISLLGTAWIFLAWLGLIGFPLWAPLGLAIAWGVFCFWKI